MSFTALHELLPELAEEETRTITIVKPYGSLPAGSYGIVEMYCDDKKCDCRRVFLSVVSSETFKPVAVIAYGWESLEFYSKWYHNETDRRTLEELKGPILNLLSPQSKHAADALDLVKAYVLSDKTYINRLKKHYMAFKEAVENRSKTSSKTKGKFKRRF